MALIRALAGNTGLTAGLSRPLADERLLSHDRGRVLADLACAIADGGEAVSDFRVIGDQRELFGLVASVPTVWRTLDGIGRRRHQDRRPGQEGSQRRPPRGVGADRCEAWRPAGRADGRQGAGGRDLHPAGRLDRGLPLGEGAGRTHLEADVRTAIRCWPAVTIRASRWPGRCARAALAAAPPP